MPERAVASSDCAMAIALPLTESEFLTDFAETQAKDFARGLRAKGSKKKPEEIWDEGYKDLAALGRKVLADAAALGVTTAPRVTLASLSNLLSRFHVVTLFAHAPLVDFEPWDILDAKTLIDRIGREPGAVTTHLRRHLERHAALLLDTRATAALPPPYVQAVLARELNRVIEPTREFYATTATAAFVQRAPSHPARDPREPRLPRGRIEEEFPNEILPGPSIEFGDRMRTAPDIISAVPQDFDGVLDLSSCVSVTLGEAIKRKHRAGLVVVNERLTPLGFRLASYRMVLREITKTPYRERYTDVTIRIRKALSGART